MKILNMGMRHGDFVSMMSMLYEHLAWFIHLGEFCMIILSVKFEPICRIAYDFSFDDDMAKFGCEVYSFDPSMTMPDHKRESGVRFFNLGLANYDSFDFHPRITAFNNKTQWAVKTLKSVIQDLRHRDVFFFKFT